MKERKGRRRKGEVATDLFWKRKKQKKRLSSLWLGAG